MADRFDAYDTTSEVEKAPTGIPGFDDVTGGGLPRGRTTLVIGGPGAGKTICALSCLANGARRYDEPGIFVAFEENARQLAVNAVPFGRDLPALERDRRLVLLDAQLSPSVVQSGDFDLGALLAVLAAQLEDTGARRVVFDGVDVLLTLLNDPAAERREIFRIHEWLQEQGVTGILTTKAAEGGEHPVDERCSFLQFMVDCVVELHHRLAERVALRSLRVRKYRGSGFAEGEFPLVISRRGIEVSTFGPAELDYPVFDERLSTGVERLDAMLDGGYDRGSSVLVSGAPGTAETTLASAFVESVCRRGASARTSCASASGGGARRRSCAGCRGRGSSPRSTRASRRWSATGRRGGPRSRWTRRRRATASAARRTRCGRGAGCAAPTARPSGARRTTRSATARAGRGAGDRCRCRPCLTDRRPPRPTALRLRLYVAGVGPNSVRARANLDALLARCGVAPEVVDVVDCLQEPRRALADAVLVTPTLVRVAPGPRQVVVGCLTDAPRVLAALGLETCGEQVAARGV